MTHADHHHFRSAVSVGVVALLPVAAATSAFFLWKGAERAGWETALLLTPIPALSFGLVVAMLVRTSYRIVDGALQVRSGLSTRSIPIARIRKIEATPSLEAAPAWSLDRLAISYGVADCVVISPRDRPAFIAALREAGLPAEAAVRL